MRKIELLAPARTAEAGRIAVDHGADAVYIGPPAFGARYAAGNSIEDIARLVEYARLYRVRVYAALNTLIFDRELPDAERIARGLIAAGVDALIIQDPALLRMGLEGVEFHASTQMCNTSPEWVRFLEASGFSRVILERGLTIEEITEIRRNTSVELECFVHGAICVGFSGACYLSRSMGPRSGNRGECSQPCRLPYELVDASGTIMMKDKHVLSVMDMDMTLRLETLVDAGVSSFKIEGRLKDDDYLRNTVWHYRRELDRIIAGRDDLKRASSGTTHAGFLPDPSRSFSRGASLWMADGKSRGVACFDTPKATGAYMGMVRQCGADSFSLDSGAKFAPGDGICYFFEGELRGTNINAFDGERVTPNEMDQIAVGTKIYRNYDHAFHRLMEGNPARRKISVSALTVLTPGCLSLVLTDEDGTSAEVRTNWSEPARDPYRMMDTFEAQLRKTGDTPFEIVNLEIRNHKEGFPFFPVSKINQLRREALENLRRRRISTPPERIPKVEDKSYAYPCKGPGDPANVVNGLSEEYYRDHGVTDIPQGFDLREDLSGECVMTTAYCLRRELGICLKETPRGDKQLYLRRGIHSFRLDFDCGRCLMKVIKE